MKAILAVFGMFLLFVTSGLYANQSAKSEFKPMNQYVLASDSDKTIADQSASGESEDEDDTGLPYIDKTDYGL